LSSVAFNVDEKAARVILQNGIDRLLQQR
jgi:hypothetical protein